MNNSVLIHAIPTRKWGEDNICEVYPLTGKHQKSKELMYRAENKIRTRPNDFKYPYSLEDENWCRGTSCELEEGKRIHGNKSHLPKELIYATIIQKREKKKFPGNKDLRECIKALKSSSPIKIIEEKRYLENKKNKTGTTASIIFNESIKEFVEQEQQTYKILNNRIFAALNQVENNGALSDWTNFFALLGDEYVKNIDNLGLLDKSLEEIVSTINTEEGFFNRTLFRYLSAWKNIITYSSAKAKYNHTKSPEDYLLELKNYASGDITNLMSELCWYCGNFSSNARIHLKDICFKLHEKTSEFSKRDSDASCYVLAFHNILMAKL